jgi:hypothetical protein
MTASREPVRDEQLAVVPANEASCDDLGAVFGTADYPAPCQCQRFKVPGWIWRDSTQEERTAGLLAQTACGDPTADSRRCGARALEAYPMITQPGKEVTWGELHVGARQVFEDAGFEEVGHPTVRRVVMRIEFE